MALNLRGTGRRISDAENRHLGERFTRGARTTDPTGPGKICPALLRERRASQFHQAKDPNRTSQSTQGGTTSSSNAANPVNTPTSFWTIAMIKLVMVNRLDPPVPM